MECESTSVDSPASALQPLVSVIHLEGSQPASLFLVRLLPYPQSCCSLRAGLPWAQPRLIWTSSRHVFCRSLCPLGNHGFPPEGPGRAFGGQAFGSQLSLRGVCRPRGETAWLWQPEAFGNILSSTITRKQGEKAAVAVSPTPRTSQKGRCPIWDFPVSSLWLGACPPHLGLGGGACLGDDVPPADGPDSREASNCTL